MIDGTVTNGREAVIPLEIRGTRDSVAKAQASVDTGYNGFLTLPRSVIEDLALPFAGIGQAALGDGRDVEMDVYVAFVLWGDEERGALVLESEGGALLGMALLDGCRLTIDVKPGGVVRVEGLPDI